MLEQRARFTRIIVIVRFTDLILCLPCVARFSAPMGQCVLRTPPVVTLHTVDSQTIIYTLIKYFRSQWLFFLFHFRRRLQQIYLYFTP